MGIGQWSSKFSVSFRRFLELCFVAAKQKFGRKNQKPMASDAYFTAGIIHFNLEQNLNWRKLFASTNSALHEINDKKTKADSSVENANPVTWEFCTEDGLIKAFSVIPKPQESLKYFPVQEFDYWRCQVNIPSSPHSKESAQSWRFTVVQPNSTLLVNVDEEESDCSGARPNLSGDNDINDSNQCDKTRNTSNLENFNKLLKFIEFAVTQPEFSDRIASVTQPWSYSVFVNLI